MLRDQETLMTQQPAEIVAHGGARTKRMARRLMRATFGVPEIGVLLPLIALTVIFDLLNPSLLSPDSIGAMLRAIAFVGLIAVGEAMLMICGELDLGVGSVAGLCAIASGYLMASGWPVALALLAGVGIGALAGLANGMLAVLVGVPAFIATLGMLYIARGINYLICHGIPLPIPHALKTFGEAEPLGVSWAFLIFIFTAVVAELCLRFTTFGRKVFATGGNAEVARIAGINTSLVKISVYVLTGALSGAAGILTMAQYNVAQPETGAVGN